MLQKITSLIIILLLLSVGVNQAQQKTILKPIGATYIHNGKVQNPEVIPISKLDKLRQQNEVRIIGNSINADDPLNLIDTLFSVTNPFDPNTYNSNFGFFSQDRMVQWFQAPADLYLNQVGFTFYSRYAPGADVEMKIVELVKPREELEYLNDDWWGWYEATGNGYHDATAFLDDPDRTGPWVPNPQAPDPDETFGNDIWGDGGVGYTFTPITDSVNVVWQFIDMTSLPLPRPDIAAGTIFGVVLKNTAPEWPNGRRVGMNGTTVGAGGTNQFSLWKYYSDANTNANQCPTLDCEGWWSRDIALGYAAVVEIYGEPGPNINSFTTIPSDIELGPFTIDADITDTNPSGGLAGVDSAIIQWSIDEGSTWSDVLMSGTEPNFTGQIPVQSPDTRVTYRIRAVDVNNNATLSSTISFYVFEPTGVPTLVVFNGFSELTGFPQDFYFGPNVQFDHDTWNYGKVTAALLNNYTNVVEIWNEAAGVYNDDVIRPWLEGDGTRNYLLAGQEWLGAKNAYVDSDYVAGDFEYDILGIDSSYNDISYYFENSASTHSIGDSLPTLVIPQAGTLFGQPLVDLFSTLTADSMMYTPLFETGNLNWQDGFIVVPSVGVEVDMMVETRGTGDHIFQTVRTLATMSHRELTAGNKIAFLAYDPISLNTAVDDSYPYYYWVGNDTANSVYQALKWFQIPTDVEQTGGELPTEFTLAQNYPNPFNPATIIKFSIPEASRVTLKVYDILGEEVATLIDETKNTGNYEVDFDASDLASGMYVYRITAGNYVASKKMMLLK